MTKTIIDQLNFIRELEIECPNCGESFSPKSARLFSIKDNISVSIQKFLNNRNEELHQNLDEIKKQRNELRIRRKNKPKQIKVTTESINFGKIVEKIIPSFHNFPFDALDCRALYEPIDYVVFNNLSKKGVVDSVIFTDVKSGGASLQDNQKQIKRLVENGKVKLTVTNYA